jgi:aminoglycoside 3-N-acetyltransferase I
MTTITTRRLEPNETATGKALFTMMAAVFGEVMAPLGDAYVERILARPDFWAIAAFDGVDIVGGRTAHTLPMTREEASEIFLYDIAVREDRQRRGIGRRLVAALRQAGSAQGLHDVFVPADDEDEHALDFYRALGGEPQKVTLFTFRKE